MDLCAVSYTLVVLWNLWKLEFLMLQASSHGIGVGQLGPSREILSIVRLVEAPTFEQVTVM